MSDLVEGQETVKLAALSGKLLTSRQIKMPTSAKVLFRFEMFLKSSLNNTLRLPKLSAPISPPKSQMISLRTFQLEIGNSLSGALVVSLEKLELYLLVFESNPTMHHICKRLTTSASRT